MYVSSSLTPDEPRWERWETDRRILRERFPRLRHLVRSGTNRALALGAVEVDVGAGRFEKVEIEMHFSGQYPDVPPRVWDRVGRWSPDPNRHIQRHGDFCLGLPGVDLPATRTPEEFDYFLGQLLVFLHDQFIFDARRRWLGKEWEHGYEAAYTQFVAETLGIRSTQEARALGPLVTGCLPRPHDRCPCGSGFAFRRCHADPVERVRLVSQLEPVPNLVARLVSRIHVA